MAIDLKTYGNILDNNIVDEQFDDFIVDRADSISFDEGFGDQVKNENILRLDEYTFRVSSNVEGASVLINGQEQYKTTPTFVRIKKSDLFGEASVKTITIKKDGYVSNERYEIFVKSLADRGLDELSLARDEEGFINLKDIDIRVRYYVNDVLTTFNGFTSILTPLNFTLRRESKPSDDRKVLTTVLTGDEGSAVLERIRDGQVFDINSKSNDRRDKKATRYLLRSVDTSSYIIGAIRLTVNGKTETRYAEDGESLTTEIILNTDTQVEVITQRLVIKENRQPRIKIPNTRPRMLNKNEPTGIPIAIMKNEAVKAITVIIGEEMIEFDNLPSSKECAITLPAKLFENLGSYNVKIFPYSIEQLERFTKE